MSAQPVHPHVPGEPRVPRTVDGISTALQGGRRMEFYRELGMAPLDQAEAILRRWWCEAMLDTDPKADQIRKAALEGTLPVATLADVLARRERQGLPLE
ncbi:hypothetical protein OG884_08275 [Streptosporangium sp. NBC_01755]|uniref:hypothetical protein n=1 Tax=unclassified Streptosporangium TaxID=2632669 RepID=UPI002DD86EFD|nr:MULTISPECIES: hypothetical protein [unclassified Streptosporangium]WSA26675.1 hypothetical protein OIE13_01885 [Streptosporangium sp. NBC_01810]WSD01901.1 hypothetical protein OG884_08275 [Streptosporangium sp. NBC_01755]